MTVKREEKCSTNQYSNNKHRKRHFNAVQIDKDDGSIYNRESSSCGAARFRPRAAVDSRDFCP